MIALLEILSSNNPDVEQLLAAIPILDQLSKETPLLAEVILVELQSGYVLPLGLLWVSFTLFIIWLYRVKEQSAKSRGTSLFKANGNRAPFAQPLRRTGATAKSANSTLAAVFNWQEPSVQVEPPLATANNGDGKESDTCQYAEIAAPLGLNLRQDPQPDGVVFKKLEPGTIVELLDNRKQEGGITWREIRVNDQSGWVSDAFLVHESG